MAILKSFGILMLCVVLSQTHHHGHRGQPFRAECVMASNNDTAKADSCVQCFNATRVLPQTNEGSENETETPGHGHGGRFSYGYFDSAKLSECIKNYLGDDFVDCGDISSGNGQNPKITSFRILGCISGRFAESVGRECEAKVRNDDIDEYFECKHAAFEH